MYDKFSLENFKKWMSDYQPEAKSRPSRLIGLQVESKINYKRIPHHVLSYEGNLKDIIIEFRDYGGKITNVEGIDFSIKTDSGSFTIHRCYVRKKEEE